MAADFAAHCAQHYRELLAYALRLTHHRATAEDVVQDTYISALQSWDKFVGDTTDEDRATRARYWLHTIAHNRFVNHWRKVQRHRECALVFDGGNEPAVDRDDDPGLSDEVTVAVERLSVEHRMIVVLADFRGESYRTISVALGVPIGTVMSRLARARRQLAGALRDYARDEYGLRAIATSRNEAPEGVESDSDGIDRVV